MDGNEPVSFTAGDFLVAEVGGDVFLVERSSGESYRIGGSGGRLWSLLTGGASVAEAAEIVARETDGSLDRIRADAEEFVTRLEEIGALRRNPDR